MKLNRREFIGTTAAAVVLPQLVNGQGSSSRVVGAARPNILHIMVDQMQWAAISGRSECRTPNINRLATQGINFERSYTPSAVCCPARAMLCTGAYHWHNGVFNQVHSAPSVSRDMFKDVVTYSQRLKDVGYRQGYVGKWHASFKRTPLDFGYEEIAAPNGYNNRLLKKIDTNPDRVPEARGGFKKTVMRSVSWPGDKPFAMWGYVEGAEDATHEAWTTDNGIRMMQRYAAGKQPWHMEVSYIEPHDPYFPLKTYLDRYDPSKIPVPKSFYDKFEGKPGLHRREAETWGRMTERDYQQSRACYYASCEQLDAQIGRLLDALDKTGKAENTLVTFSTDHGDMVGAHHMWIKGWIPYEEGYRIPMIMRWPARIKPGLTSNRLVQLHDLAYTYVDAAGANPLQYKEGRSLLPLAENPRRTDWPDQILCAYYGAEFLYTQRIAITDRFKYVFNGFDYDECYDLERDPQEMHNCVNDAAYKTEVADMQARMYELMSEYGDPFGDVGPRLDGEPPNRYGAPRYLPRGKRLNKPAMRT